MLRSFIIYYSLSNVIHNIPFYCNAIYYVNYNYISLNPLNFLFLLINIFNSHNFNIFFSLFYNFHSLCFESTYFVLIFISNRNIFQIILFEFGYYFYYYNYIKQYAFWKNNYGVKNYTLLLFY